MRIEIVNDKESYKIYVDDILKAIINPALFGSWILTDMDQMKSYMGHTLLSAIKTVISNELEENF
jgi:hypothetical protein